MPERRATKEPNTLVPPRWNQWAPQFLQLVLRKGQRIVSCQLLPFL